MFFSKKFIKAVCLAMAVLMGLGIFAVVFNVIL